MGFASRLLASGLPLMLEACTPASPAGGSFATSDRASEAWSGEPWVVVELFTSEGCSSCPATDQVLRKLAERSRPPTGAEPRPDGGVIVLGFHVDYWDDLGWPDRFAKPSHTQRQRSYAAIRDGTGLFTPEAVVDGATSVAGSRRSTLTRVIAAAAESPKATLRATCHDDVVSVQIEHVPRTAPGDRSVLLLAVTEAGLRSDVRRGENAGRILEHAPVVRELADAGPATVGEHEIDIDFDERWKRAQVSVVAFIQEVTSRRIVGAALAGPCD